MINTNLRQGIGLKGPGSPGTNSSGFGSGFQRGMSMNLLQIMIQVLDMFNGGGGIPMFGNFGRVYYGGNGLTGFLGAAPNSKSRRRKRK